MEQNFFKQFKIGAKINRESKTPKSANGFFNIPKNQDNAEGDVNTLAGIQEVSIDGTESPSGPCEDSSDDGDVTGYRCYQL